MINCWLYQRLKRAKSDAAHRFRGKRLMSIKKSKSYNQTFNQQVDYLWEQWRILNLFFIAMQAIPIRNGFCWLDETHKGSYKLTGDINNVVHNDKYDNPGKNAQTKITPFYWTNSWGSGSVAVSGVFLLTDLRLWSQGHQKYSMTAQGSLIKS